MLSRAFVPIRKSAFALFRNIPQAVVIYGFASFRKLSQGFANGLSQRFAKDLLVRKSWFFEGFAMGTLLMKRLLS